MQRSGYRIFINGLSIVGLLTCLACASSSEENEDAQVRIGQFLWSTEQATVSWYLDDELVASTTMAYGELSGYESLKPNTYWVKVKADDALILEKEIGLGTRGIYTAVLTGIPENNQPVNKKSTADQLHQLVEGAAARTANDYLPQLIIQNDFFVPEPQKGNVRWFSLMPGTVPLDISLLNNNQSVVSASGLTYPQCSNTQTAKPGEYDLAFHLNHRIDPTNETSVDLEDQVLHTYFLIPNEHHYLTTPTVVEGVTHRSD